MTLTEALEHLLPAYSQYYDVNSEPSPPFAATAQFHSHGEKYILIRQAKLWDMDSHEYVYFAVEEQPDTDRLSFLIDSAWNDAIPQVKPSSIHRNSDVTLILITQALDGATRKAIKKNRKSISYKHGFQGWSNLRIGAIELSDGRITCNRHGDDLKDLFGNIKN